MELTILNLVLFTTFCLSCVNCRPDLYLKNEITKTECPPREKLKHQQTCGYASCPKPASDKLNVHLVPHTHDDVGWLKTVDQYYYGSQTLIQKAGVQYIIDSVVQELLKDPKKRFIYVESAFFFKWWREQDEITQAQVKQLVNEGRLEFIGGAWSMNDEATAHYQSIIDQFSWGLRRLNDTFGICGRPKIGWQIDPFGHSREMASIFAHMGYDGLFFGRLDYEDKRQRLKTKTAEMIWQASANQGKSSNLFTGVLYNQYQPPEGFCFDILCADEPIIDGKHSPDYNVDKRIGQFFSYVKNMSQHYKTKNVLITMGEDFHYQNANIWYMNLDKLIKYANEKQSNGSDINLFYSTPSCYLKALHDANEKWPTKSDDFFPYASDPHAFWTGYFTSRPTLKRFERVGNHFLQISKQLFVLTKQNKQIFESHLTFMRETMGILQHHDAITGTEKQKVAFDYAKQLAVAFRACEINSRLILNTIVSGNVKALSKSYDGEWDHQFEFKNCLNLNISQCDISENSQQFTVTVYNPLSHSTFQYVRVPVMDADYQVMDYRINCFTDIPTESQMVPVPSPINHIKYRSSNATNELVFLAAEVPPLGYKSYFISKQARFPTKFTPVVHMVSDQPPASVEENDPITIGNKYINITIDNNGLLSSVSSNGITTPVSQKFFYYDAAIGNNMAFVNRSSGAYIFRPNNTIHLIAEKASIHIFRGPAVDEIHQIFNDWISQVIRVYKNENHIEFEWMIGPIPIDDGVGKEIVTRFDSDIKSNGVFFTDSNGREEIRRKRNERDTWTPNLLEKVAGNYYPLTAKIAIEDQKTRMAVLVDRAQGGSSLKDGSIEIMIHRRLLHDDAFGVEEALNETAFGSGLIVRGQHYLVLGPPTGGIPSTKAQERFLQMEKLLPNWLFFSNADQWSYSEWRSNLSNIGLGISQSLPQNINLMTLEPWHTNEILLRFEHILEKEDDEQYSKPITFNLKDVLRFLKIQHVRETTLDGNMWLDEMQRLTFTPDSSEASRNEFLFRNKKLDDPNLDSIQVASKPLITTEYWHENLSQAWHRPKRTIKKSKEDIEVWNARSRALDIETLPPQDNDPAVITLSAMQIRTFIITLEPEI
ncbi:lysosomal alpha-mannosidase isoform X2 [Hermetia illucens]|uniref:lysosomal alpha-mannosidase isoform X2 n=1 Tax=Hermetia illucens TaxID=343691 RepID=UPI0018CC3DAD|nr:lysosomal alpha-mannosidase isoform X2 [Hermetia illucens]